MSAEAGDECPGRGEEGGVTVDRAEPVGRRHDLGVPRGIAAREEHGEIDAPGRERRELCRHEGPSDRVPEQDPETRHGLGRWEPTFLEQCEASFEPVEEPEAEPRSIVEEPEEFSVCLLYTSPSPRDRTRSRMPSSA